MSRFPTPWLALVWAGFSCTLYAVDGVVLIDQNRALAGSVTPGDAPGFPVTLSVAGSYRLSGNLTVPDANTTAIQITADSVTLDLNGFSILGPVVCSGFPFACSPAGTGRGVDAGTTFSDITVVNGTIRGMGGIGIFASHVYIEKVHLTFNGGHGMSLGGDFVVTGNTVRLNGGQGIYVLGGGVLTGNTFTGNGASGMYIAGCPTTIVGNRAFGNPAGNLVFTSTPNSCVTANNAAP